ncbi:MAG TPA: hypothetical protein PKA03_10810 [Tabrizicola sp.]|nr:hypothetical protein [Tabrizicola sp.]
MPDPVPEPAGEVETVPDAVAEAAAATVTAATEAADSTLEAAVAEAVGTDTKKSGKKAKTAEDAEAALAKAISDPVPETASADAEEQTATEAEAEPPPRAVDDKVLSILREEAEREAKARRGENPSVESQPDLGIDASVAPRKKAAGKKREPVAEAAKPSARRDLLPDVEEINSTLRPAEEPEPEFVTGQGYADPIEAGGGFRAGFMLVISLTLLATALYISAGRLSSLVPALSGPLSGYVGFVDGLRLGLDGLIQSATVLISGDGA